ncbi:MAG: alanine--tRNA ligase-related protein [Promethearchaeota archaeon]|jgi:alanyl-tRNA synthetase
MTEKLYWQDAYETKFVAMVKEIKENGVVLDRTLFYPESGNQSSDRGYLKVKGSKFEVKNVTKEGEEIIHHISIEFKEKIKVGDIIEGEIDWDYRYGLMKAHSSQHIFSAILKSKYDVDTNRAILNFEDVFIQMSQSLDYDQLNDLLYEVNAICTSTDLNLDSKIMIIEEAKKVKSKIRSTIPNEPQIRLIEIGDIDLVCCGGTHIRHTTEIGSPFIYNFKNGSEFRYFVGNKAALMSSQNNIDVLELTNELNITLDQFKEIIKKRLDLTKKLQAQQKDLSLKLLESIAKIPLKIIDNISLFFIDFDVDIKILSKCLDKFPPNSLIIVNMGENKIRLLSMSNHVSANNLTQELIKQYGGKGGGNPKSAQGVLEKTPADLIDDIEQLIK